MPRHTLNPGDVVILDPVQPGHPPQYLVVQEDSTLTGNTGLSLEEAVEILQDKRVCTLGVLYKSWDEEEQRSYATPDSVLEEIERRQEAVQPAKGSKPEIQDKIPPQPIDFTRQSDGLW